MSSNSSVVIPALNEKENLSRLIPALKNRDLNSIYIIDDMSNDGTEKLEQQYPGVHLLTRGGRLGLISAEIDGMRLTDTDYVVVMDADLSHRPEDVPGMVEQAIRTKSDLVIGSRYMESGITNDEFIRQVISKIANMLFRISFDVDLHDCTSGFRVYSREACDYLGKQTDIENGYVGQVDIVSRLKHEGFKITEYPVVFVKRTEGKSKLKMREIVNFFLFVVYNKKMFRFLLGFAGLVIIMVIFSYLIIRFV
jgi:dolichol-phosphate mannosyltransferase